MKKKIIGILICTLLITATVLPVAGNVKIKNNSEDFELNSSSEKQQNGFFEEKIGESKERAHQNWITKVQTIDGGYIATGLTNTYGAGDYDAWLIKTDSDGNEQWNKTYGEDTREWALGLQQTSDDGYIIVGSSGPPDVTYNVYLIKTYETGGEVWSRELAPGIKDHGYFVQQTSDGGYIICAKTTNTPSGFYDIWLIKTDSIGLEEWNQTYGGDAQEAGYVVRELDDGYIIIGSTSSYGSGDRDVWLIKTDENGNKEWDETYGGADSDRGHDVHKTSDGGYIIIGGTSSYGDGDNDFYLIKTDENGNEEWYQTFDGSGVETDISIMGYGSGMCVLETPYGYIMMGTTDASYGSGSLDILVIGTDENGNEEWNQTYGGSGVDEGYWMDETSDGGYILCGATESYGPTGTNGWLIEIESYGNELWNETYPKNFPPYTPSDPDPEDGETDIPIDKKLSWTGGDPNGDPVSYDIYFGTESPPPKVQSNQSGTSYNPGLLDFDTEYFWKIVAWDSPGGLSSSGAIWSFTTEENLPPNVPSNPDPADGATDVSIKKDLKWVGGDPNEGDEITYDVYFGTSSPPPLVSEDQDQTEYDPGIMELATTYYWQIVTEDSQGLTTDGPIWSFTTEEEPNDPPTAPEIDGPKEGPVNTELCWTFHSDDPNGHQVKYIIEWGDGNSDETTFSEPCTPVQVCHTYDEKGTYVITASAEDEDGETSTESTLQVKIPRQRSRFTFHPLILKLLERFPIFQQLFKIYQI